MDIVRSKIILVSDFKCCQKYKHTLPPHVELIGDENIDTLSDTIPSLKSLPTSTDSFRPASTLVYSGIESLSTLGSVEAETLEPMDEILEDEMLEIGSEAVGEESDDELSVCSDWIVLKQRKKTREKALEESSVTLSKVTAGQEGEVVDSKTPQKLIPSGFFKYKDFCKDLPKTPPLEDEALRKRAPSPNNSLPKSDVEMYETTGEDWIWFEGRYLEGGTWEVAAGEDGEYYRMQKQWKEGHWEPAPWLVEKWEKEELELEKERLKELEEKMKYDEILKREDSPGMDIMNWGYGPVKLTRWKEVLGGVSVEDFAKLLSKSLSHKFLEETSEMSMEAIEEMSAQLSEAVIDNSFEVVRAVLTSYFSENLALAISEKMALNAVQSAAVGEQLTGESQSCKETLKAEEASEMLLKQLHKTVEVEVLCDVIPEDFRNLLLSFARQFVNDLPRDPLQYAVTYFEDRIPQVQIMEEVEGEGVSDISLLKLSKRRKSMTEPSAYSIDISVTEKTEAQVEMILKALHDCWLLKDLGIACYISLVREMYRLPVSANSTIRTEEDEADHMYVIESGTFQLSNKQEIIVLKDQGSFGDVSLVGLNNIPFPYDAVALTDGVVWCLHKHSFINSTRKVNVHRERLMTEMMMCIELFDNLYQDEFYKLIHCAEIMYFQKGDVMFCENTKPMGIYFILFGDVKLIKIDETITKTKGGKTKTVKKLKVIGSFSSPQPLGHENIVYGDPWEYSCVARSHIVEVALLKSDVFERVVGDVEEVINRPVREITPVQEASIITSAVLEDQVGEEYEDMEVEGEVELATEEGTITPKPEVIRRLSLMKPDIDDMI